MSEKGYLRMVDDASNYLKRCMEAKTPKNKISFAKKSLKAFKTALDEAQKLKLKVKIPYIYEYMTQLNIIISIAFMELKQTDETVKYLNEALRSNKNATPNKNQKERYAFIVAELAKISSRVEQFDTAVSHATRSLHAAKDLDPEDLLDLYIELNPVFIKALKISQIKSNYKEMIKLAKKSKRKNVKAAVYFDYARYLFDIQENYSESKKYLEKVKTLYTALNSPKGLTILEQYYNSKFDSEGNPIVKKKEKKIKEEKNK